MTLMWIAITVLSLLAITVSVYALQLNKRLSLLDEKLNQQISLLRHELTVINSAAIGVGQRLINTEKKLKVAMEKQQQFETVSVDNLPFNHAVALAENGADAQQLVERCGLSEAEAELVALLQSSASHSNHLNPVN